MLCGSKQKNGKVKWEELHQRWIHISWPTSPGSGEASKSSMYHEGELEFIPTNPETVLDQRQKLEVLGNG